MSTLLSLYGDIWSIVLEYISSDDLGRLALSTPSLSTILWRTASKLDIDWKQGWLNLNGCLRAASRYHSLSHFSTKAFSPLIYVKGPFNARLLPSNLCSLELSFAYCLQAILISTNLDTITPNLQHLKLTGVSQARFVLGTARFPSKLLSLFLSCNGDGDLPTLRIEKGDIKILPKTLKSLELRGCIATENAMESSDFAPGLTSLTIEGGYQCLIILENLPRTIEKLRLELHKVRTASAAYGEPLRFPWRAYFPKLVDLYIHPPMAVDCSQHLMDPQSLRGASDFDPIFERIDLESASTSTISASEDHAEAEIGYLKLRIESRPEWGSRDVLPDNAKFQHFVPRLTSLRDLALCNMPVSSLSSLKNLTTLDLSDMEVPMSNLLPPNLTSLSIQVCRLSLLPPSLLSLKCYTINDDLGTHEGVPIPLPTPKLINFTTTGTVNFTESLAHRLPTTIESLHIAFPIHRESVAMNRDLTPNGPPEGTECDKAWRAMAKRFVRLKRLSLDESLGFPSMRLEPIASPQFEYLELINTGMKDAVVPWLSTLLDDRNTEGRPPVFPPSLKTLKLVFYPQRVPLCIIPMLPRSLTHFETRHMEMMNLLPNFPFNPRLTTSQMLEHLPPKLKTFIWKSNGDSGDEVVYMSPSSLQYWPRSLEIVDLCNAFVIAEPDSYISDFDAHNREVANLLPPTLSFLRYGIYVPFSACHKVYLALPANKNLMNATRAELNEELCESDGT